MPLRYNDWLIPANTNVVCTPSPLLHLSLSS
jgi:hypothetical protein